MNSGPIYIFAPNVNHSQSTMCTYTANVA